MTGNPRPEDSSETEAVGDAPTQEEPAHRPPDQSTVGLAPSSQSTGTAASREVAALDVGETLAGRFRVLRLIARGRMGAVYEASDALLRTRVALKVIGGRLAGDTAAMERFRREVLLARRVSHPNVCRVYELYEGRTARGIAIHFLTMELLEGESLARRLARSGRMKTEEALPLVKQMCEGLAAAHAEGVIHRDFKSSNVLLVPSGRTDGERGKESTRVVITDFGVARAVHVASEEEAGEGPLTGQGILGTPESMAPEQMTAKVTAATDVYALGVVLYEMVTGKLPFSADIPLAAAARRLDEAPPRPEATVPGLDQRWAATIVRCLARQPERRFRSAGDVIPALERPARRRRLAIPIALAAALLLGGAALAIVRYRPWLRLREPETKTALATPRAKVAILGVRNELGVRKLDWLPTAVTELLAHEAAAAESSLRLVGTDWIDLEHRSLGVSPDDLGDERTLKRLQALLDADVLVHGSVSIDPTGSEMVRLRLYALDAASRKELGGIEEDLGPDGEHLAQVLPELGTRFRNLLGGSLSPEEEGALFASRAHSMDAVKSYAEGMLRWRHWDLDEARERLEAALAADPTFLQAQRAIALTWGNSADRKRWLEAWRRIRSRPAGLTAWQAAVVDLWIEPDRDKRVALFEARPDDLAFGFELALRSPPRATIELIGRLRQLRAGLPLVLDFREAFAAKQSGEIDHASELLDRVAARAIEIGARWELGRVREIQGDVLYGDPSRFREALARYQEAERLYTEVGELPNLAGLKGGEAFLLRDMRLKRESLQKLDEAAALSRRLGNRAEITNLLIMAGNFLTEFGELDAARKKLEEARRELEAVETPRDAWSFMALSSSTFGLAMADADLAAARKALSRVVQHPFAQQRGWGEEGEADLLRELDQPEQARASRAKAEALMRPGESRAILVALTCSFDCDGDQPAAGLACLAQRCRADQPGFVGLQKAVCELEEARCSFRASDFGRAEKAAREAWAFFEQSADFMLRFRTHAILLQAAAARGDSARAMRLLRADLAEVEAKHHRRLALETTLALGEVELRAGRREGRVRLAKLEQEAKSREFFRIARLAREALQQEATASAPHR